VAKRHRDVVEEALRTALKEQMRKHPTANTHFLAHYLGAAMDFWRSERSSGRTDSMKQKAFEERIENLGRLLREEAEQR